MPIKMLFTDLQHQLMPAEGRNLVLGEFFGENIRSC